MDRRRFLSTSLALGCSAAASPLLTPIALASAPWENRLIVIILRGAMDGLDAVRPIGDPVFAAMRPTLGVGDTVFDLDGFFALHPALAPLMPMWQAGQLGFSHAVSTPYRNKRSHFDGQDILEAGVSGNGELTRDGWLNRMLQVVPGIEAETAFAIGREQMLILTGEAEFSRWSPEARLRISDPTQRLLQRVYHDDPLFRDASEEALSIVASLRAEKLAERDEPADDMMMTPSVTGGDHVRVAKFAASRLRGATRIASFSLNGWDTHNGQKGGLTRALGRLSDTILTLQAELGPVWGNTAVVAMTEFGRTARENGTQGTDHGTGGAMIFAGGAVNGGQVAGNWPGLGESDLFAGRDLMPTRDVREMAGWMMRDLLGISSNVIETSVFPGLVMAENPGLIL